MAVGILSTLLNWYCRYNVHNIHDCLLINGVMADRVVIHVQFSNSVTIWQRVLKRVVNTSHVRGNDVTNDVLRAVRKWKLFSLITWFVYYIYYS